MFVDICMLGVDIEEKLVEDKSTGTLTTSCEVKVYLASTPGAALADTGAGLMVIGRSTLKHYIEHLPPVKKEEFEWVENPEPARFRFGDSKTLESEGIVLYPIGVKGKFQGFLRIHVVAGEAPLLMSHGVMRVLRCLIDVADKVISSKLLDTTLTTRTLKSGHMEVAFDEFPTEWDSEKENTFSRRRRSF